MSRTLSTAVVAALSIAFLAGAVASAQSTSSTQETIPMTESPTATRFVPATHRQVNQRNVEVDGEAASLTRYERQDGRNAGLEGEHFSTVVAADGTLKGFANMSLDLVGKPLPSRERSEQIARAFLQETAPDLLPRMKISWIDPHDEPIRVQRNGQAETVTLTGMKVKARNLADGRWFWVIVGADEKPMVFERDIVWITFPGHRKTEKWLHDGWLKEQGK
ncbi:hypothetical protein CBF45_09485 [Bordetella sp. J329]|uniref:hypothetical protein n=1 Tax=Kerstersia gyiorum TaxID=206506 RepID=UPI000FDF7DB1|nr:hypothetical protein [Kerstersia gyiorum]AZV93926.1 hypothetical protein CBF45_09485 [Bordetella sp. J329]MCH4272522.1 hypothetical protein [Kerstersia gyiorum]MCI1229199.1 hypothetical protein [Kerstersia gyiorum]